MNSYVTVKTLQRLAGKCVSFSRAVPAARLFTREMNAAISQGLRSQKAVLLHGALREEISHWLFLESWDDPLPWRDERHFQISVATDASASGWEATVISPFRQEGCLPFVKINRLGGALNNGKGFSKISKPTERNSAYHLKFDFPLLFSAHERLETEKFSKW